MKRFLFLSVAAVLLSPGPVGAALTVYEYTPGEKVTYDDVTGYYWYWKLSDLSNMTYYDQMDYITELDTYGNIAGGWHMADMAEMQSWWDNGAEAIANSFSPSYVIGDTYGYEGRFDVLGSSSGTHYIAAAWNDRGNYVMGVLPYGSVLDTLAWNDFAAFVVSDHEVVPVPPGVILAALGLLSSTLGLKRLRRKHQEE